MATQDLLQCVSSLSPVELFHVVFQVLYHVQVFLNCSAYLFLAVYEAYLISFPIGGTGSFLDMYTSLGFLLRGSRSNLLL